MATVTQKIFGSFTSAGVAYDLQLPIQTIQNNPIVSGSPNAQIASTSTQPSLMKLVVWNYTEWATSGKVIQSTYLKGFAAGKSLQLTTQTTTNIYTTPTIEGTNGFTLINNTPKYGVELVTVSKANPAVFTFRGPGWTQNEINYPGISNFATGDLVVFSGIGGTTGTGWSGLNASTTNQNQYSLIKLSTSTFKVQLSGVDVDSSGFAGTYVGSSGIARRIQDVGGNKIPPINMANVGIRLGTAVVGANADVMYWEAELSDDYRALGQL